MSVMVCPKAALVQMAVRLLSERVSYFQYLVSIPPKVAIICFLIKLWKPHKCVPIGIFCCQMSKKSTQTGSLFLQAALCFSKMVRLFSQNLQSICRWSLLWYVPIVALGSHPEWDVQSIGLITNNL